MANRCPPTIPHLLLQPRSLSEACEAGQRHGTCAHSLAEHTGLFEQVLQNALAQLLLNLLCTPHATMSLRNHYRQNEKNWLACYLSGEGTEYPHRLNNMMV